VGVKSDPSHEENSVDSECLRAIQRKILGPKKDELKGDRRKLHNEELFVLFIRS
jgi:hypothetical protein